MHDQGQAARVLNVDLEYEALWKRRLRALSAHFVDLFILYDEVVLRTNSYVELVFLLNVFPRKLIEQLLRSGRLRFLFGAFFGTMRRRKDDGPWLKDWHDLGQWHGVAYLKHNDSSETYFDIWKDFHLKRRPEVLASVPDEVLDLAVEHTDVGLIYEDAMQCLISACAVTQPMFLPATTATDTWERVIGLREIVIRRYELLQSMMLATKISCDVDAHYRLHAFKQLFSLGVRPNIADREKSDLTSLRRLMGLPSTYDAIWRSRVEPATIVRATFTREAAAFRRWIRAHNSQRADREFARELAGILHTKATSRSGWIGWASSSLVGSIPIVGSIAGAVVGAMSQAYEVEGLRFEPLIFLHATLRRALTQVSRA